MMGRGIWIVRSDGSGLRKIASEVGDSALGACVAIHPLVRTGTATCQAFLLERRERFARSSIEVSEARSQRLGCRSLST
jgi:hypothetical protein